MNLFEVHRVNIKTNRPTFKEGTKQIAGSYTTIAENIPCRITGHDRQGRIKLFMLAKHYNTIEDGIHENDVIELSDESTIYKVQSEPVWAGGTRHHIELFLEVFR